MDYVFHSGMIDFLKDDIFSSIPPVKKIKVFRFKRKIIKLLLF